MYFTGTSAMFFRLFILWLGLLTTTTVSASLCKIGTKEKQSEEQSYFKQLLEAVNGDSLTSDGMNRLFTKLHFVNCNDSKPSPDFRKCFTPTDLYNVHGSLPSKPLNYTEFTQISPAIVYCLLPASQRNNGGQHCTIYPKNNSELFNSFARNFSGLHSEQGITHEALEGILEEINKTIGAYLSRQKCFSAENVLKEIEGEHHGEGEGEEEEGEEHDGDHHEEENKILDQEDFQKACASIVMHLVQGFCIEEKHEHNETKSSLPSKEFFIKDLFKQKERLSEEDLEEIAERLGIGKISEASPSGGDSHGGHEHSRRRRSAGSVLLQQRGSQISHDVHRRSLDAHGHGTNDTAGGTCFSLDNMLSIFGIDHSVGADACSFKELCPAFIQQSMSKSCEENHQDEIDTVVEKHIGKIWGYGFVSVTIISITSLVGVATIPFMGKNIYKKILALLVALAVGSLAGDSLLHLLPHALGLHEHEEETDDNHDEHEEEKIFVWKSLVLLSSVYVFFLFESLMHLTLKGKVSNKNGHNHVDVELPGPLSRHMNIRTNRTCSKFEHHEGSSPIGKSNDSQDVQMETGSIVLTNVKAKDEQGAKDNSGVLHDEAQEQKRSNWSLHSLFSGDEEKHGKTLKKISAVAWMVIIGDTLHNISDGLAIGAAFSEGGNSGISGGISTSIAVFCHELPHELGDFAVLLTAGMSVKMALVTNLFSAMSCYIGLVIGIYVGQQTDVRLWIFAIAAGMFLYIALVDMLPDLMHSEALQTEPAVTFLCQNIGLLLGIGIMLVIALYEEQLMAITF